MSEKDKIDILASRVKKYLSWKRKNRDCSFFDYLCYVIENIFQIYNEALSYGDVESILIDLAEKINDRYLRNVRRQQIVRALLYLYLTGKIRKIKLKNVKLYVKL